MSKKYTSVLLQRDGAVEASGVDAGVAAHYGAPTREARSLFDGTAVADLSHLDILQLRGEDRLTWLDTISSQRLSDVKPGQSTQSLLLSVQGRVEHELKILAADDLLWIIAEPGRGEPLAEYLNSMRFMSRVEVVDCSNTHGVIASTRPRPELGDVVWENPWPNVIGGGHAYSTGEHPGLERPWFEYIVPLEQLASLVGDLSLAGTMAVEALRIAAWEPRFIVDTDDKSIPHELDWLRTAVHLNKGCYKGQETIARVHNLGHPPRRLAMLHLDGSMHTLPAPGSPVKDGERVVGRVTSVALHYEAGPIALATLRRNVQPDAELVVQDGESSYPAAQEVIVSPEAGQVAGRFTGFLRPPRG